MSAKRNAKRLNRIENLFLAKVEADLSSKKSWVRGYCAYLRKTHRFTNLEDVKKSEAVRKHFSSL